MDTLKQALGELKKSKFVLLYDSDNRERETDLIVAGEFVTPAHIATMRRDGGGLICAAMEHYIAEKLNLPYTLDIYDTAAEKFSFLRDIKAVNLPYDERSSFSLMINHRKTFTGISDKDRALTIREFAQLGKNPNTKGFTKNFRSPGHVPLLIAADGLLKERRGQTELSVALMRLAGLTPVSAICEMLGFQESLSKKNAMAYAKKNKLVFLEGDEVIKAYENRDLRHHVREI